MTAKVPQSRPVTICRLCDPPKPIAQTAPLNVPLEGQPDKQAMEYLTLLFKHVNKRHGQSLNQLVAAKEEIGVALLLQFFDIEDQSVADRANAIKDTFISQFARHVADEHLAQLVTRLNLPAEHHARVLDMALSLRDLFTCRGRYAPNAPKEAPPTSKL